MHMFFIPHFFFSLKVERYLTTDFFSPKRLHQFSCKWFYQIAEHHNSFKVAKSPQNIKHNNKLNIHYTYLLKLGEWS